MKKYIIFLLILLSQISFSQWEKTSWNSDKAIMNFYAKDSIIFIISDEVKISTDYGKNWNKIENPIFDTISFSKFYIDGNIMLMYDRNNLYLSTDFANTFQIINNEDNVRNIISFFIKNNKIYAGTGNNGLYVTSDLGLTWDKIQDFNTERVLKYFNYNDNIVAIAKNGVHYSTDLGQTWNSNISDFFEYKGIDENIVMCSNNIVIGTNEDTYSSQTNQLFVTTDMGKTWIEKNNDPFKKKYVYTLGDVENNLLLNTGNNLYTSTDLGETWTNIEKDFQLDYFLYFIVNYDTVYIFSGYNIYVSYNKGINWQPYIIPKKYCEIESLNKNNNTLYSITRYTPGLTTYPDQLFSSSDKGDTWIRKGFIDTALYSIKCYDNNIFLGTEFGLLLSTDNLLTYKKIYDYNVNCKFDIDTNTNTIITYGNIITKITTDLGETWIDKSSSMPKSQYPKCFAFYNDYIIMGTECCMYISSDNGDTWIEKNNGLPIPKLYPTEIRTHNNKIYLLSESGLFVSTNIGDNWEKIDYGGVVFPDVISSIAFYGNNIFITTIFEGVFLSTDEGKSWRVANDGLYIDWRNNSYYTNKLEIVDDYIFVGTYRTTCGVRGNAIYRAKLSDFGISSVNNSQEQENNISIFPNPSSDNITLKFENNITYNNIKICNQLGEEIKSISGNELLRNNSINISTEDFSPGIYYCTITSNGNRISKSFVVIR